MTRIFSTKSFNLIGKPNIPADKSISHRAVILSSMAKGVSYIKNLLNSEDVKNTINCFKKMGVNFTKTSSNEYVIDSLGMYNFKNSIKNNFIEFNMGNSGTTSRLLMGVLAGQPFTSKIMGDSSLSKRPMLRVLKPLSKMGLTYTATNNNYLPIILNGGNLTSINYTLEVPSAQVKSAILLAALYTNGKTTILEPVATRDHTENMLKALELDICVTQENHNKVITLNNIKKDLPTNSWQIPSDFSSAAFFIASGLLIKKSKLYLKNININPLRAGVLKVLKRMKAKIEIVNSSYLVGEPVADLIIQHSNLNSVFVDKTEVSSMIDEFPILFILASFAEGVSEFKGIEELRYKESDRILKMEQGLNKIGIKTESTKDSIKIWGNKDILKLEKNIEISADLDHRIAMSFVVMGLASNISITINGAETIESSFPNFIETMQSIKANVKVINE